MASILKLDTIQNLSGQNMITTDGNGSVIVNNRFRLPVYTQANLPSSANAGELVYDETNKAVKFWTGARWMVVSEYGDLGSQANPALNAAELSAAGITTDGDYWYRPNGTNYPLQLYTNFTYASANKGLVLIQRGRESLNYWPSSGQNTSQLTSAYLTTNTPVANCPQDFVQQLIGGNWLGMRCLVNRHCVNDSYLFVGTQSNDFRWSHYYTSGSSAYCDSTQYTAFWGPNGSGTAQNAQVNHTSWTDTNGATGNNCNRSFSWTWSQHGGYQGWSTGSTCDPACGYEYSAEAHRIMNANVYVEV
jgi:hypothetical protein